MTMKWKYALVLVGGAVLCATPLGQAESFSGPFYTSELRIEVEHIAHLDKSSVVPTRRDPRRLGECLKFKAGRKAVVIVKGDHDPIVPITLEVYDDQGKLVARDEPGKGMAQDALGNDYAGVVWYPPRDGYYTIRIASHGSQYNKCTLSIR
jgi:hypothetical protein